MESPLLDVHDGVKLPDNQNIFVISGSYDYYHYKIDGIDDIGWGCGYRTLQTICSWLQASTTVQHNIIPSLNRIQEILVDIDDKSPAFIGSRNWIGTFEAFLVIDFLYDVPCKVVHLQKGELIADNLKFLIEHFQKFKSPVMMGGDIDNASKCILGISYNEDDNANVHLLVLDPHYHGQITSKLQLQKDGCVSWTKLADFNQESFYNFCLPQIA